jgi:hypothetical protein
MVRRDTTAIIGIGSTAPKIAKGQALSNRTFICYRRNAYAVAGHGSVFEGRHLPNSRTASSIPEARQNGKVI